MILKTTHRLDAKTVAELLALKSRIPSEPAKLTEYKGGSTVPRDTAVRDTEVRWIDCVEYPELGRRIADVVMPHVREFGLPQGVGIERKLQMGTYHKGHHFDWHHDGSLQDYSRRALSMSILLTDDFDGGRLEFKSPGAPKLKKPGDAIIFHSTEQHRVTPVTRGVRDVLVAWFGLRS